MKSTILIVSIGLAALPCAGTLVGKVEVAKKDGLEMKVEIKTATNKALSLIVSMRFLQATNKWLLNDVEVINLNIFDKKDRLTVSKGTRFLVGRDFIDRKTPTIARQVVVEVALPEDAGAISFGLGRSGLETRKIPVPK